MITQTFQQALDVRPTVSLDVNMAELHLEIPCPQCNGNKSVKDDKGKETLCHGCRGLGVVPTANGARLLAFLRRHLQLSPPGTAVFFVPAVPGGDS